MIRAKRTNLKNLIKELLKVAEEQALCLEDILRFLFLDTSNWLMSSAVRLVKKSRWRMILEDET